MQASVVSYSEVVSLLDFRVDGEYWHPEFIENSKKVSPDKVIKDFVHTKLENIKSSPIGRDFEYLEISKISLGSISYETSSIKQGEEPDRAQHILRKGDVAVSTVRPNRNAVAFIENDGVIGSSGLAVLRAKKIEKEYLFAFCKSDYFIKCLMRANKASMYPAVSRQDVLSTPIFLSSTEFRKLISSAIKKSILLHHQFKLNFKRVQSLLLAELNLESWQPKCRLAFVKSYSDAKQAERIDAEFFQPKYDDIIKAAKNYSGGWDTLENLVNIKDENHNPEDKLNYKYIELASISTSGEVIDCIFEEGQNLPSRARRKISTGDVIVSSIEGSLASIALIDEEYNQALCSTGFYVINSTNFDSEVLFVLLKSIVGQLQLKKGCSGTILTAISKDEFKKIILPKIVKKKQLKIQQKVTESLNFRKQSKQLLEFAKKAVEMAIEKDEQKAMKWLQNKTKEIQTK